MRHYISFLTLIFIFTGVTSVSGQQEPDYGERSNHVYKIIHQMHYQPQEMNDSLSARIFEYLINDLDSKSMYFTQTDFDSLSFYKLNLDDQIKNGTNDFLKLVTKTYEHQLGVVDSILEQTLNTPFDYSENSNIEHKKTESFEFAKNNEELSKRWFNLMKYDCMRMMIYSTTIDEDSTLGEKDLILSREPEMRKRLEVKTNRSINKKRNHPTGFENYVGQKYLNAIAACYDPHSSFFTLEGMDNFEASLSNEGFSFGIEYEENDAGELEVTRLVPGGPAWNSNEMHKGDVIQKIKTKDQTFDLSFSDYLELHEIFASLDHSTVEFTIRKSNGFIRTVNLKKEKIKLDENTIKSFILKGEKNIGYISLPGFYSDSEDKKHIGCSHDIARSLVKMKYDEVAGVILDLRFNGGGNMKEAVDLAGVFINEGPVSIYNVRNTKPQTIKDINRGTIYDGPLVILINNMSASASELTAAVLQDYNRAVIVGNHSFGKATSQTIYPLGNPDVQNLNTLEPRDGFVKLTIGKFYRVNGSSHQNEGVQPDIYLPDLYENINYSESMYLYSLPKDSVEQRVDFKSLSSLPLDSLLNLSNNRIQNDNRFQQIVLFNDSISKDLLNDSKRISFNIDSLNSIYKQHNTRITDLENLCTQKTNQYAAVNLSYDVELLKMDKYTSEIHDRMIENITKDMYIEEAFNIIIDLIRLNK